jgi:regulator of sirC expression with transglutaminase-like and TPR domain
MSAPEIAALLQLLEDDDAAIREAASQRLIALGARGAAALREAARSDGARLRGRARLVLQRLEVHGPAQELIAHLRGPSFDLETASILLSRVENPGLDPAAVSAELDRLGSLVADALAPVTEPAERARVLGLVLSGTAGFRGNAAEYYDPRNSFLDQVLERRLGIPISLSTVCILVGRRAGLDLRGVGMPLHFLVQVRHGDEVRILDPYGGGRILTRETCRALLAGFDHGFREEFLRPVSDRDLFRRALANLVPIYRRLGDRPRAARIQSFLEALQEAPAG